MWRFLTVYHSNNMCSREEIQEIIKEEVAIVRGDLVAHEGREVQGHQQLEDRINDRIDHVIVAIRASHPSVEMVKEVLNNQKNIEEKIDALKIQTSPAVKITSTISTLREWLLWVGAPVTIIIGIIMGYKALK